MSKIFKNKTIVILSVALIAVVSAIGVALMLELNKPTLMIDLSGLSEKEVVAWYKSEFNDTKNLVINNKYDEKIENKKFISQSVEAGKEITNETKLTVAFSKGPNPETVVKLPDFVKEKYNKAKIEKFFTDNKFLDVTYEYVVSEEAMDTVLKVNVSDKAKRKDVVVVTLSVGDKIENISVKVPDLTTFTLNNAKSWASGNAIKLTIDYKFDEKKAKDTIIYQSVAANTTLKGGSSMTITVSKGQEVVIKDLTGMGYYEVKDWCLDNGIELYYEEAYSSTVEVDHVISQYPYAGTGVEEGSSLEIVISKGIDPSSVTIKIEDYTGKTEDEFKKYVKSLSSNGFSFGKINHINDKYSDTIEQGLVAWHTSGNTNVTSTVEYYLSLGKFTLDQTSFNNRSLKSIEDEIYSENKKGAGVNLIFNKEQYNPDVAKDNAYGCVYSDKTLTCGVSLGKYIFTASDFNDHSVEDAQQNVDYYNGYGANISGLNVISEEYNSNVSSGNLFACEFDGSAINCKKSKGSEPVMISISNNYDIYTGNNYDDTVSFIMNTLGGFENLTINAIYDDIDGRSDGQVIAIYVNGNKNFTSGKYDAATTEVVIEVVKK